MRLDRRIFFAGLIAVGMLGALSGPASAQTYAKADLDVAGPLGDKILGNPDAPVTIIEYASMTCTHCQRFDTTVFQDLKAKYIDTGKVRYIFREYPLDAVATVAVMIARCAPNDQFYPMVDLMFQHQNEWAFDRNKDPIKGLFDLVKQTGFTQETFDACWKNQKNLDHVTFVRNRAQTKFGVNGTPTFFINGIKKDGEQELATFETVMAPFLAK